MSAEEELLSDEEYEEEEIEEVEAEAAPVEETPAEETPADEPPVADSTAETQSSEGPKLRRVERPQPKENEGESLTEAEQAMLELKRKQEEESEAKIADAEARRRQELADVETELEALKQRQIQRKAERELEEAQFAERRRADDERRRAAEEERKKKIEAHKQKKEEEKQRRQVMMAGSFVTSTINNNKAKSKTAEQTAEAKRNYIASINRPADVSALLPADLKMKIKQLYQRIVKLEGEKLDLESRSKSQDYDLKELTERRTNASRNKAKASGQEIEEAEGGTPLPPKISTASKHERRKDHRTWGEKRTLFENPPVEKEPILVHGSGRPPVDWRPKKQLEEIETLRKNLEPPKYVEHEAAEGEAARPPVPVIPMQIPTETE